MTSREQRGEAPLGRLGDDSRRGGEEALDRADKKDRGAPAVEGQD